MITNELARAIFDTTLRTEAAVERLSARLVGKIHKWKGQMAGGDPCDAGSREWVRYCEYCGQEDACEDPLPPCTVTRETLWAETEALRAENQRLKAELERRSAPVSDVEWRTYCCAFDENALALDVPYLTRENADALISARANQPASDADAQS